MFIILPKDVFAWIKENTPKSKSGNKTARYFQSLDDKVGKELLRNQLVSVTMLLKLSRSWQEFKDYFARSLGQTQIDFPEPLMILPKPKLLSKAKDENQQELFNAPASNELIGKANFGNLLGAVSKAAKPPKEEK